MEKDSRETNKVRGRPRSFDRDLALERAMQVFWRRGYESASLAELTAAMGINPPSLYAAFGDKEQLFMEAIERYAAGPGGAAARILAEAATARDAVERLLEESAHELTRSSHPPGCMVVTSAMSGSAAAARVQAALAGRRAASEAVIRARIDRAVEERELPADTDPAALARFYMTVIQGMTVQARDGATRETLLQTARAAMRAWPDPIAAPVRVAVDAAAASGIA